MARNKAPVCGELSFAAREAFKRLRTNLVTALSDDGGCRLIGVTSSQPGDGKSTVAVNLAYSLAELENKRVLLIDADMRRSSIHEKLSLEKAPGLRELLDGASNITGHTQAYTDKGGTTFSVIAGGTPPENPSELLNSERMQKLLQMLSSAYDFIVVDLPPVGTVIDAVSVSRGLSGMLVVIRENTCPRGLLNECVSQLRYAGVNILGFVMNGALEGSGKRYQYGNYGGYGGYNSYYGNYYSE